jgi:membrane carboxypeptidase/penicillin-binding protein PbpC
MFKMKGAYLTCERNGKVMHVQGDLDTESRYIYSGKKKNHMSQQWDIIYSDQWKRDPKKGELNKRFGFYVERDFYVVSRLGSGKYLDLISNKPVIKTRNGRKTQTWWFDQKTLTVKSRSNNYSWNINSSGNSKDIIVTSTNSNWW